MLRTKNHQQQPREGTRMPRSYVPILKWKAGERRALHHTATEDRQKMIPLLELLPDGSEDAGLFDAEAAKKLVKDMEAAWGTDPAFVDPSMLGTNGAIVGSILQAGRDAGLALVPVVWVAAPVAGELAAAIQEDQRGACFRVDSNDALKIIQNDVLSELAAQLRVQHEQVDILLDLGSIDESDAEKAQLVASAVLPRVMRNHWRSVTFAASSFPPDLSGVGVGMGTIQRAEWGAYKALLGSHSLGFGDYCVAYPEYSQTPYRGSAAVRYTIEDEWLIVRGRTLTRPQYGGFAQFHDLCAQLVADPRYCGPKFSWGDRHIQLCAQLDTGTGNLTTWRQVATNHHLAFVSRQVSSLSDASSAHVPARVGP